MLAIVPSGTIVPGVVANLELLDVLDLLAELGVGLDVHLPGAAEAVEIVDVERAEVDLERVEDFGHGDAHGLGLVAVDVEEEPGRVGAETAEQALQAGDIVAGVVDDLLAHLLKRGRPLSPRSSMMILKPPAVPRPSTGGAPKTFTRPSLISSWNVAWSVAAIASPESPRAVRSWKSSSMTYMAPKFGALALKQDRLAGDGHGVLDARGLAGDFLDAMHDPLGPLHRGGVGQLDVHQQVALVLHGNEARGGVA